MNKQKRKVEKEDLIQAEIYAKDRKKYFKKERAKTYSIQSAKR